MGPKCLIYITENNEHYIHIRTYVNICSFYPEIREAPPLTVCLYSYVLSAITDRCISLFVCQYQAVQLLMRWYSSNCTVHRRAFIISRRLGPTPIHRLPN
jgi:hypothetical protein